jgi:hypothetical protein
MKKIFILVTGNSSSGKSLIVNNLCNHNFLCFALDSYMSVESFDKLFKNIKNNYGESTKYFTIEPIKKMVDQAIASNKNVIFDTVEQKKIIDYLTIKKKINQLYIINVFTNLNDIGRNLESRRKEGDRRGMKAFLQYSNRYIKCNDNNNKRIETVNRNNFKKMLIKYFKYEFNSKIELVNFSITIFKNMNITDDNDHYIKLRNEYKYDYLLITTGKSKEQIFQELNGIGIFN